MKAVRLVKRSFIFTLIGQYDAFTSAYKQRFGNSYGESDSRETVQLRRIQKKARGLSKLYHASDRIGFERSLQNNREGGLAKLAPRNEMGRVPMPLSRMPPGLLGF
jgi:hypothetical protein